VWAAGGGAGKYRVEIVPMMNPDGVVFGNFRRVC
jgi:hypothetical protein